MVKKFLKISLTTFILFVIFIFIIPHDLDAESIQYWVDTSHWETTQEWINEGHNETNTGRRWINTSYTVSQGHWKNYTETIWVDTSHWVNAGYWEYYTYREWVTDGYIGYRYVNRWVDTSHWVIRYRTVEGWVPCNRVFYYGTNSYGWGVYAFASRRIGRFEGVINGTTYRYIKSEIDYNPSYGGRVYAIKYECYAELIETVTSYLAWVRSGYWNMVREGYWVDTSHWVTRYGRRWINTSYWLDAGHWEARTSRQWIDTSYTVSQGHWENYTETIWVDTSHWEFTNIWVEGGHWVEADIFVEGMVRHTDRWNQNRIAYNMAVSGEEDSPRPYEVFFNGEKFVLNAFTTGEFEPESITVEFVGEGMSTELEPAGGNSWTGFIWDETFINFHDRECRFIFTAHYEIGANLEDEVVVTVIREDYRRLKRGY